MPRETNFYSLLPSGEGTGTGLSVNRHIGPHPPRVLCGFIAALLLRLKFGAHFPVRPLDGAELALRISVSPSPAGRG